jgi:putative hydrolase
MDPTVALERAIHCLDRAHEGGFKTKAFIRALTVVQTTNADEISERAAHSTLTELPGIGESTALVISQALNGDNSYLTALELQTKVPITIAGQQIRSRLRGDCHLHSRWSDGGASISAMAHTAVDLGHEYMVLTDHSPRLTVAHGLNHARLMQQLDEVRVLNEALAPFRILTGIEVDILEDGALDHDDETLAGLDIVVASLHSKLKMPRTQMTERMLLAVTSPHVDILGHCTGRLIDKRDPSSFDEDLVFTACATYRTAVEINCRPERLDPPRPLLARAVELGCYFAIDSDAHATGQLEWQPFGCDRAAEVGVPPERIINTWGVEELLAWTTPGKITSRG